MSTDRRNDRPTRPLALAGPAPLWAICFLLLAAACCGAAGAQTSITATIASEYSLRGLSLSDARAVPQLRIDHDTAGGAYAGLFASRVFLRASEARASVIAYGGYARRLVSGFGWDAGVSRSVFVHDARYNYTEVYAGISSERASARLSLSPDYYGAGRTAYIEVNAVEPLGERLRISGHAGLLRRFAGQGGAARERVDLRVALGTDIGDASIELGLQARQRDPGLRAPRARALFASASMGF
jgi:uncharacterized protein (TIGR02001 family)